MLTLRFNTDSPPNLASTEFSHPLLPKPIIASRGREATGRGQMRAFSFSPGFQALCILLLRTTADAAKSDTEVVHYEISGEVGSAAAALDGAFSKKAAWLSDVFGSDTEGESLARRLFQRTNPERKRSGPVSIRLRDGGGLQGQIRVFVGDRQVDTARELCSLADQLEKVFLRRQQLTVVESAGSPLTIGAYSGAQSARVHGDDPAFLRVLHHIFEWEIREMLMATDIFRDSEVNTLTRGVVQHPMFGNLAGKNSQLVSPIDSMLSRSNKLGIAEDPLFVRRAFERGRPLRVAIPACTAGSLGIFAHLRYIRRYPIEISFNYPHAVALLDSMVEGSFARPQDLCVLGVGQIARYLGLRGKRHFHPLMHMPKISYRIVRPAGTSVEQVPVSQGCFHLLTNMPSSSVMLFDDFLRSGAVDRRRSTIESLEPDLTHDILTSGVRDSRVLLFFPHFQFATWFGGFPSVCPCAPQMALKENFLLMSDEIAADSERARAIDIAVRDSWLELVEKPLVRYEVVKHLVSDPDLQKVVYRMVGASNYSFRSVQEVDTAVAANGAFHS